MGQANFDTKSWLVPRRLFAYGSIRYSGSACLGVHALVQSGERVLLAGDALGEARVEADDIARSLV